MKPLHTATSGSCCLTNLCGPKITGFFPQFCSSPFVLVGQSGSAQAYSDDHKKWGKEFGAFGVFSLKLWNSQPTLQGPMPM
jgi:hypothetical protein